MSTAAALKPDPIKNTPAEDDVTAVNLHKIRFAQDRVGGAKLVLKETQSHAEAKGIHLKAAKKAFAIIDAGDAEAWLQETSKITTYLRILRHGVRDGQLSLDLESNLAPIDERAELDGRSHGLDVAPGIGESDNPHDLTTSNGQAWLRGFRQGRTERDLILSMRDDVGEDEPAAEEDED
ncbi:hypothetical protein [Bradyrhizobium sp. Tv2a-2]|uniref:hypothetical protein n=1 Tax=Bradyrhizobium sp. Tv2a-2 TaxID=113395 RepID=UPI0003FF4852|nr:hypothetical protein [Bradyrhizobium sp. Tv2a-2]